MNDSCPPIVLAYFESSMLHSLHWTQFVFSFSSIIIVIYTITFHLRKSWFEEVFKETLYALYFFILWHSALTALVQVIQISARLTANTPCDMQIDKRLCIFRVSITFSFPSFVCVHFTATLQRVLTTFSGNRRMHLYFARCSLALTFVICLVYVSLGFVNYPLEGRTPFCKASANNAIPLFGTVFMMLIDCVNVLLSFFLVLYNRKIIRGLTGSPLEVKFRHRQTLHSTQQMLPVTVFHLFCFTAQFVGFEIGRVQTLPEPQLIALNGFLYMMPYYCFICPAFLLWFMINEKRRKERELRQISTTTSNAMVEAYGYFEALQSQWSHYRFDHTQR